MSRHSLALAIALLAIFVALAALVPVGAPSSAQSSQTPSTRGSVVIAGGGDVLAHIRVVRAARANGWDRVLSGLTELVRASDVAFANLETPLSEERPVESGSPPILGAPPELATGLATAGIDVLSIANNHAWDQWARGAERSVAAVRAANMGAIGAGPTLEDAFAPHVITRDGTRIAFVGITERVNAGPGHSPPEALIARWDDDARVASAIERARSMADVVVVSIHWSHDFVERPNGRQRERARLLVDHGADVILGHGPHVLHVVERMTSPRGEAICVYSLGNLLSNQGNRYRVGRRAAAGAHIATWLPASRDGAWIRVPVTAASGRITIGRVEAVPLFTFNNFWEMERDRTLEPDIRVQRLAAVTDVPLRDERRPIIAATLGSAVTLVDR
ncbi:MAG: CapA family protein [Deltaproteobacteria bacterium]|nr:CapA family protein [Deltaproteobacteria bacterium]